MTIALLFAENRLGGPQTTAVRQWHESSFKTQVLPPGRGTAAGHDQSPAEDLRRDSQPERGQLPDYEGLRQGPDRWDHLRFSLTNVKYVALSVVL